MTTVVTVLRYLNGRVEHLAGVPCFECEDGEVGVSIMSADGENHVLTDDIPMSELRTVEVLEEVD